MLSDYPPFITSNDTELCVAPGCTDPKTVYEPLPTPRQAVPETDLCPQHHREFHDTLRDLARDYLLIERSILRMPPATITERVQTSGTANSTALWNPAATLVTAELKDWAFSLTRTVLEQRILPEREVEYRRPRSRSGTVLEGPAARIVTRHSHGLSLTTQPATALAALSLHHAYWLSSYPTLGADWLREAKEHKWAGERALNVHPSKRVTLTGQHCQEVVEDTELGPILCGGQLYGLVLPEGGRPSQILCGINPRHRTAKPAAGWFDLRT